MAMFGKGRFDPSQLSGADRLALIGATLRDVGGGLRGDDTNAVMQTQSLLAQRQQLAQQQAFAKRAAGLFGGGAPQAGPVANAEGSDISAAFSPQGRPAMPQRFDPRAAASVLAEGAAQGFDIGPYAKLAELAAPKPQAVNGRVLDFNDPNSVGTEVPEADKGQVRLYDADGRFAGIKNADGYVKSAAELAAAVEGAKAKATAPYEFQTIQGPDGRPITGAVSALAGQVFQGQSPTEATQAAASTDAAIHLPQSLATSQGALDLIAKLKVHPGLDNRTGLTSVVPAMPGTAAADFDTMATQLRGKVFLEAFSTLKGAGAITDREGQAATDAIARLNQRQTKDGYVAALDDLQKVIQAGMQRQQQKAGRSDAARAPAPPRSAVEAELRRRGLIH